MPKWWVLIDITAATTLLVAIWWEMLLATKSFWLGNTRCQNYPLSRTSNTAQARNVNRSLTLLVNHVEADYLQIFARMRDPVNHLVAGFFLAGRIGWRRS